jgi:hypothetical protein
MFLEGPKNYEEPESAYRVPRTGFEMGLVPSTNFEALLRVPTCSVQRFILYSLSKTLLRGQKSLIWSRRSVTFMQLDISLSCSQEPTISPYLPYSEPNKSRRHCHISFQIHFNIILVLDLPCGLFRSGSRLNICKNFSHYPCKLYMNTPSKFNVYIYVCNSPYSQ